jgi:tetratricopeptide (TPR) repeat protein/predicted Ser/Thr protein kinase
VTETCLDDNTLAALGDASSDDVLLAQVDVHIDSCVACRALVADLARASVPFGLASHARGASFGRFMILDVLGAGAMGVVYVAFDPDLERKIALKVLRHADGASAQSTRERILAEARAMARLSHRNVVTVHEVGVIDDQMFIAAELVEGTNLRDWLAIPRRPNQILEIFVAAARGLLAAHEAGVVHCDFKPHNVLVGHNGRVAVADFGLARIGGVEREVGGTPAYLAPERIAGQPCDERSDQFAFCVALYDALARSHPFAANQGGIDVDAMRAGRITREHSIRLPRRVRAIVERGLDADPSRRFPSMATLAAALERARRRRPIWWIAGAAALVLGSAGVGALVAKRTASSCDGFGETARTAWNPKLAGMADQAFRATNAPFAPASLQRASQRLEGATASWAVARREVCLAIEDTGGTSATFSRAACLEDRLRDMTAVGTLLSTADTQVVEGAVRMVEGLGDVGCASPSIANAPLVPADPALRLSVEAVRRPLANARARSAAGDYRGAMQLLDAIDAEARALSYAPGRAEYLLLRGDVEAQLGRVDDAVASLLAAVADAEHSNHDVVRARALTGLSVTVGSASPEDGLRYGQLAAAALDRAGGDELLRANIDNALSIRHKELGHLDDAERHARAAIAAWERQQNPTRVAGLLNLASVLRRGKRFAEADEASAQALDISERSLGRDHPYTAAILTNFGNSLGEQERYAEALPKFERALAIEVAVRGERHPRAALARLGLGNVLNSLGRHDDALAQFAACGDAFEPEVTRDPVAGYCLAGAATAHQMLGHVVQAVREFERAIEIVEAAAPHEREALEEIRTGLANAHRAAANRARRGDSP